ncbi:hypothetical protein BHM03_00057700, partial [Ensete ventricosum]
NVLALFFYPRCAATTAATLRRRLRYTPSARAAAPTIGTAAPAGAVALASGSPSGQEIVYLCIPDPDGKDEGRQTSSSLAVSNRWISAAKLLQSDLATLTRGREENRR